MKSKKQRAQERLILEEKIHKEQLEKLFSPNARSTYKKNDMAEFKKLLYILSQSYSVNSIIDYPVQGVYTCSFNNGSTSKHKGSKKGKSIYCREHNNRDEEYVKTQNHIKQNGTGAIIIDGEFYDRKDLSIKLKFEECDYIIIKDESLDDAYEKNFSEAVEKYNRKQKRKDRRYSGVKDYMNRIRRDPQRRLVYESIAQIGNKTIQLYDQKKGFVILMDFLADWQFRNPNLYIVGAYYHRDEEGAPHLHIDYIPISRDRYMRYEKLREENKLPLGDTGKPLTRVNGLDVENSLTDALDQMGYKNYQMDPEAIKAKFGFRLHEKKFKDISRQKAYDDFLADRKDKDGKHIKTRLVTRQMQWEHDERMKLIELCNKYGVTIENPMDQQREHMDTPAFKLWKETENVKKKTIDVEKKLAEANALRAKNEAERESLNNQIFTLEEQQDELELLKLVNETENYSIEQIKKGLLDDCLNLDLWESKLNERDIALKKEIEKYEILDAAFQEDARQTAKLLTNEVIRDFKELSQKEQNIGSLGKIIEAKIKNLSANTLKRAYGLSKESSKIFGMNPSEIQTKNDIDKCITKLSKLSKEMEDNGKTSITEFFQNKKKNVGKDGISV